jgi:hypothetical protein
MRSCGEVLGASLEVRAVATSVTESPIEAAMLVGLIGQRPHVRADLHLSGRGIDPGVYSVFFVTHREMTAIVVPQLTIQSADRYRLDFGVILERGDHQVCAAIECDGVEFHSSLEDVKRDKARDRSLAVSGWLVMRFPGQEIVSGLWTGGELAWRAIFELPKVWSSDPERVLVGVPGRISVPTGEAK